MVRFSGKSMLYLPQEYSPCSLILPTCIRATAQHLAQHVATRGLFRVPGSSKVIGALFDYYCFDNTNVHIASTVRCATLPLHIQYSVHDVASTFKRLLSVLPGGILGSLALLDSCIAIHSQLNGEPEYPRTKQTKVRARLIALAIGTIKSQYRRELICAVFGLLSLIGRIAEVAPREDGDSRPLPTADLMGYNALGIVFGPLLVSDLLDQYIMKVATPSSGMLLFPLSPPRFRRDRRRSAQIDAKTTPPPTVDKILVANNITEMLISNWRDVVRQMKSLGTHCRQDVSTLDLPGDGQQPPTSKGFNLRVPGNEDETKGIIQGPVGRNRGQEPESPTHGQKRRRLKVLRRPKSHRLLPKMSIATLSPTKEESMGDDESSEGNDKNGKRESVIQRLQKAEQNRRFNEAAGKSDADPKSSQDMNHDLPSDPPKIVEADDGCKGGVDETQPSSEPGQVYLENVPPRESSKYIASHDGTDRSISRPPSQKGLTSPDLFDDLPPDSNHSTQTPKSRKLSLSSAVQEDVAKQHPGFASPASPSLINPRRMPLSGIRVVEASPSRIPDREAAKQKFRILGIGTSYTSQDQGVQCDWLPEMERRQSIDITPERFYPDRQAPAAPGELNELYQGTPGVRVPTVIHQPRLSRSHGHLRSQTTITLQSPTESTESKGLSKRGSVKAMAAMFENQNIRHGSPVQTEDSTTSHRRSRMHSRDRHSKSDSAWTHQPLDLLLEPLRSSSGGSTPRGQGFELHQVAGGRLDAEYRRASLDAEMDGNYPDTSTGGSPFKLLGKPGVDGIDVRTHKAVPSLGTMVPCPEQPPIAHHLNLARPTSSPSPMQELGPYPVMDIVSTTQVSRPRSATILYSQIRNLQRQLNAKTDEAAQLRRQLEAQKDSDIGTVSEQLRQATRDVAMWKDRAETAERRVKVFEKFTVKLKEIRDAIADTRPHIGVDEDGGTSGQPSHQKHDSFDTTKAIEALRLVKEQDEKSNATEVEDTSVVAAKLKKRFHGLSATQDGTADSDLVSTIDNCQGHQSPCNCLATRLRQSSEQIWAAAEKLLQLREDGVV